MKYQVLKHLKTKCKTLKLADSLQEAKDLLKNLGASFRELSFIGQFPVYSDGKHAFSIQGGVVTDVGTIIVCSLPKEEIESYK